MIKVRGGYINPNYIIRFGYSPGNTVKIIMVGGTVEIFEGTLEEFSSKLVSRVIYPPRGK